MKIPLKYWILAGLIGIGIFARAAELDLHFTHTDDMSVAKKIMDYKRAGVNDPFVVPGFTTYAPFQFLFTHFLIHPEQTYRQLLFWARLPSCGFGILGLFALVLFYQIYEKKNSWTVLTATAILAFSWENIVMAKQAHNYALGVTACILLLTLFVFLMNRAKFSASEMALAGFGMALLASMHYQILFLIPGFFMALLFYILRHPKRSEGSQILRPVGLRMTGLISCGAIFLAGLFPLYFFFLKKHMSAGTALWNFGPNREFLFDLARHASIPDKIIYTDRFFFGNFFEIFRLNTAFLPYDHPASLPASILLFVFFLLGIFSFFMTDNAKKQSLGIFFAGVVAVWMVLAVKEKITWSPTRHNLILLPFMAVIIAEGAGYVLNLIAKFRESGSSLRFAHAGIALVTAVLFLSSIKPVLASRRDPFREDELLALMQQYQVDALITADWTLQPGMMKSLAYYFHYYDPGFVTPDILTDGSRPYRRIAYINHRKDLSPAYFEEIKRQLVFYNQVRGRQVPNLTEPLPAYRVIYERRQPSNVEIDFSSATQNGANGFYFYILERI